MEKQQLERIVRRMEDSYVLDATVASIWEMMTRHATKMYAHAKMVRPKRVQIAQSMVRLHVHRVKMDTGWWRERKAPVRRTFATAQMGLLYRAVRRTMRQNARAVNRDSLSLGTCATATPASVRMAQPQRGRTAPRMGQSNVLPVRRGTTSMTTAAGAMYANVRMASLRE
jgi:hypothetical protein